MRNPEAVKEPVLKKVILIAALMLMIYAPAVQAQEQGPLVMSVEFQFTLMGIVGGAALGMLVWMTDPANPNTTVSDQVATGAAWGALLGAGGGIFILQKSMIAPRLAALGDPLRPSNRIRTDPLSRPGDLFAMGPAPQTQPRFRLPLLNLRF